MSAGRAIVSVMGALSMIWLIQLIPMIGHHPQSRNTETASDLRVYSLKQRHGGSGVVVTPASVPEAGAGAGAAGMVPSLHQLGRSDRVAQVGGTADARA